MEYTYVLVVNAPSSPPLPLSSSCLNPMIYGFMSKSFRDSFSSELRHCCRARCTRAGDSCELARFGGRASGAPRGGGGALGRSEAGGSGRRGSLAAANAAMYERNTRLLRQAGYTVT